MVTKPLEIGPTSLTNPEQGWKLQPVLPMMACASVRRACPGNEFWSATGAGDMENYLRTKNRGRGHRLVKAPGALTTEKQN